jgi:hypothetical protein
MTSEFSVADKIKSLFLPSNCGFIKNIDENSQKSVRQALF